MKPGHRVSTPEEKAAARDEQERAVRNTPRCCATVYTSGYWSSQCSRKGVVEEGGNFYCKQHAPSAVQERRDATHERWDAEARARSAQFEKERLLKRKGGAFDEVFAELQDAERVLRALGFINAADAALAKINAARKAIE